MGEKYFTWYCLLFVLFLALPLALWPDTGTGGEGGNSENALNRLIEISVQLSNLNERLQTELQDSRQNSRDLTIMLEESRTELEALRNSSTGLLTIAESSQTELTALTAALRRAESSLTSLELSFAAYRQTAENRIRSLERGNRFWKWGAVGAGILAVGFGTAFLISQ